MEYERVILKATIMGYTYMIMITVRRKIEDKIWLYYVLS